METNIMNLISKYKFLSLAKVFISVSNKRSDSWTKWHETRSSHFRENFELSSKRETDASAFKRLRGNSIGSKRNPIRIQHSIRHEIMKENIFYGLEKMRRAKKKISKLKIYCCEREFDYCLAYRKPCMCVFI